MECVGFRRIVRLALGVMVLLCSSVPVAWADSHRTTTFFLRAMSAERAISLYARTVSERGGGTPVAGPDGKSITVRDTVARLERFGRILEILDQKGAAEARIYARPIQHMKASDAKDRVSALVKVPTGIPLRMAADDRSGILVVMTMHDVYLRIDTLLRRLDVADRIRQAHERRL